MAGNETPPSSLDKDKAARAAAHPDRPGEQCGAEPGRVVPIVNRNKCEGKHDCVDVCPYHVFEVRRMEDADFGALTLLGKLKSTAHKRQTSYTPRSAECRSCGLCVVACPEGAIRLVDVQAMATRIKTNPGIVTNPGLKRPPTRS